MATAAEQTFANAVRTAEGIRQSALAAAFATYAFVPANLSAYLTAVEAAHNTYATSVNSAASTLGAAGYTIPNSGTPNPGNVTVSPSIPSVTSIGGGLATMGAIG